MFVARWGEDLVRRNGISACAAISGARFHVEARAYAIKGRQGSIHDLEGGSPTIGNVSTGTDYPTACGDELRQSADGRHDHRYPSQRDR